MYPLLEALPNRMASAARAPPRLACAALTGTATFGRSPGGNELVRWSMFVSIDEENILAWRRHACQSLQNMQLPDSEQWWSASTAVKPCHQ